MLCFFPIAALSQIDGDVTGDNLVDASDYFSLQKIAIGIEDPTNTSDLNRDGKVDVLDLLILENYIYKNGPDPPGGSPKPTKHPVTLIPGKVDTKKKTIEILIQNREAIGAFQFDLVGLGKILSIKGGSAVSHSLTVSFDGTRVLGILDKGRPLQPGEALLLELGFSSDNFEKACITRPIVLSPVAALFEIILGECITVTATMKGLAKLESLLVNDENPNPDSDINHDGYTNISDLVYLENFLLRDGPPPPGVDEQLSKKVKLQIESVDLDSNTLKIYAGYTRTVAAFQFSVRGIKNIMAVTAPKLTEHGFKISYHRNKIIAHVNAGFPLFPDKGIIMEIQYDRTTLDEACLNDPVVINASAATYQIALGECVSLIKVIPGCMDTSATNYNPLANKEDGSCEYPPKPEKPPKEKKPKIEKPQKEEPVSQIEEKPEVVKLPKEKEKRKSRPEVKPAELMFAIEIASAEKEKEVEKEKTKELKTASNKEKKNNSDTRTQTKKEKTNKSQESAEKPKNVEKQEKIKKTAKTEKTAKTDKKEKKEATVKETKPEREKKGKKEIQLLG